MDSLGLPISRFQRFKPGIVSIVIMDLELRNAGYLGSAGIDMHFFNKAKKAGKPRLELETPAFQFKLLGNLSSKLMKGFVKHNISQANKLIKNINKIITAWKHGNAGKINSLISGKWQQKNPALYKAIVLKRNRKWMPEIKNLFNNGKTTLVITGAGHMVGKNGVVAMLKGAGYQVEQL